MKNIFVLFALTTALSLSADNHHHADSAKQDRNYLVSTNPGALLSGSIWLNSQYKIGDRMALVVPLNLAVLPYSLLKEGREDEYYVTTGVGIKFFLSNDAFEHGWYIKPVLLGGYAWTNSVQAFAFTGSVVGGYGWVWNDGFSLDLGVGAQYNTFFGENRALFNPEFPVMLAVELALGYSW